MPIGRIRSVVLSISMLLAAAPAAAAEPAPASILGIWRGTSLCSDRAVAPGCKDEVVVYNFTRADGQAGTRVRLAADKIVDGEVLPMGTIDVDYDGATASWRSEIRTPKFHGLWSYSVEGSKLTGSLTDLPSGARTRRVEATRDDEGTAPMRFLLGEWEGTTSGESGEGTVSRRYETVLGDRFVRETDVSTYPPQEANPKGGVHEHVGYLSYDGARATVVLRQFQPEGFVHQYAMSPESTATKFVFASERFENFSNAWRARESFEVLGPDEFVETFELAAPGKPFETYGRSHFKRVKR